jgi:hypothetical protein
VPRQFNTEDLRKAISEYNTYLEDEGNFYDPDSSRGHLFEQARDRGFFDDYVREILEEEGYANDPEFDPDYDITQSDIESGRDQLWASDFDDAIPVTDSISVDPDLEGYEVYNFVNQNPKAREFFTNQTVNLSGTDAADRFLRSVRAGVFSQDELRRLNDIRFIGNSNLLERYSNDSAYDIADSVNSAAMGRQMPSLRPIYENTADALNEIQNLQSVAASLREYTENLEQVRGRLNRFYESNPTDTADSAEDYGTNRQLNLPIDTDSITALDSIRSSVESLPTSINTLQDLTSARNRLQSVQRDLASYAAGRNNPDIVARDTIRSSVLPQVEQALGDYDTDRAVRNAYRNYSVERNSERSDRRDRSEYFDLIRSQANARPIRDQNAGQVTSPTEAIESSQGMRPIPGLNEQIAAERINEVKSMMSRYPEVSNLLATSLKDTKRKPVKSSDSKRYAPYVDAEQLITLPESRKAVYDQILSEESADPDDFRKAVDFVKNVESIFTSGDTSSQKVALESLDAFRKGDQLRAASTPAVSASRPVVGGGRYVSTYSSNLDPEVSSLLDRIRDRSRAVSSSIAGVPRNELRLAYPDFFDSPSFSRQLELNYDPDTNSVSIPGPGERGQYGISVSTGRPRFDPAASINDLPSTMSINALKFLADNPVLGTTSVAFTTKSPGSNYSYDPKELPSAVSDAFGRFAASTALEGLPPGTLVTNSPLGSRDIYEQKLRSGETEDTSSTVRKLKPFVEAGQSLPNVRGLAYQAAGFGPVTSGKQYAYIDSQGKVVPLQLSRPEPALAGKVSISDTGTTEVTQNRLPLTSKAYYSLDPVNAAVAGARELATGIKRTPAALLPGAADLIPSEEAIRTGYREGLPAMGAQMGREFVQSLPTGAAAAAVLATPAAAPFAPGIGAGLVGTNAAKAVNEVVRQQTGEGIVPKLRQAIGTAPRTGVASPQRTTPVVTPQIRPLNQAQRAEMDRRQNRNELQRRADLVRERFNPAKGEFGISELLFGR